MACSAGAGLYCILIEAGIPSRAKSRWSGGGVEEKVLTRKDKKPLSREGFPRQLSPARQRRDPVLYVPGFLRFDFLSATLRIRLNNIFYL